MCFQSPNSSCAGTNRRDLYAGKASNGNKLIARKIIHRTWKKRLCLIQAKLRCGLSLGFGHAVPRIAGQRQRTGADARAVVLSVTYGESRYLPPFGPAIGSQQLATSPLKGEASFQSHAEVPNYLF